MAGLTTHILDLTHGKPANNVKIELYEIVANNIKAIRKSVVTNADGRLDSPLLTTAELQQAQYELVFYIGSYFRRKGMDLEEPHFLEEIPVRFVVTNKEEHYHIPLLVSPWGYQIYRGS
ncbi:MULTISPECIES: hydroxyisourate hydrolase [Paraliobacillus]|uniref:hydroxyisourate hydrolase n=1 Tax=Paraliobacillus TaxID=200903 RepID=UPI000DD3CDBF|nr:MULTISPECIES: hydroxyisourate hydrolase [Paraliobacillus]